MFTKMLFPSGPKQQLNGWNEESQRFSTPRFGGAQHVFALKIRNFKSEKFFQIFEIFSIFLGKS